MKEYFPFTNGKLSATVITMKATYFDNLHQAPKLEMLAKLEKGLPANSFSNLAKMLEIPAKTLASALGINDRTLRNRTRYLSADESERSYRAFRVFRRATEVLGDEATARAWINTPQVALGEKKPIEMLTRDIGVDTVINVLNGIEDGGYL